MALQDPERDDNTDPAVAAALYDRAHADDNIDIGGERDTSREKIGAGQGGVVEETTGPVPDAQRYGTMSGTLEPPTAPGVLAQPSLFPGQEGVPGSSSWKEGDKFSLGTTGITDRGIANTQKLGGFSGVDKWTDATMAGQRDLAERTGQSLQQSNADEKSAIFDHGKAEQDYHSKLLDLHKRESDFEETTGHLENVAMDQAKIEREQYLGAYKQQLAGVKQLMAVDANPLHGLSGPSILGLGAAAFAQGFLGAQGIHIDVTGQIDKWVDREMAAHQQKIQNAKGMADEQLSLYGIARQSSKDDAEARDKLRGFIIEGFKQKTLMEGERYQSDAARSAAKMAAAKLDAELTMNLDRLGNAYYEQRLKTRSARVQEVADQGRLAIEGAKYALESEREKRLALADKDKQRKEIIGNIIYDTSKQMVQKTGPDGKPVVDAAGKPVLYDAGGAGQARWIFKPGVQDEEKKTYRAMQSSTNSSQGSIEQIREMYRQYGNQNITDWKRFTSTDQLKFQGARNRLLSDYLLATTGKVANEGEVERAAASMPENKFGTKASLDAIYADTKNGLTNKLDNARHELADKLPENDEERGQFQAKYGYDGAPLRGLKTDNSSHYNEAGYVEAGATAKGDGVISKTGTSEAVGSIEGPNPTRAADDDAKKSVPDALGTWRIFKKTHADAPQFSNQTVQYAGRNDEDVPVYVVGMMKLAREAKAGDAAALEQLTHYAQGRDHDKIDLHDDAAIDYAATTQTLAQFLAHREGLKLAK